MSSMPGHHASPTKEAVELAWTANAYLDCAIGCCSQILDEGWEKSAHHFRVPLHLAHVALELFFKAGIAIEGKDYRRTHDLRDLQAAYQQAGATVELPIPEYLANFIPRFFEVPAQQELFERGIVQPRSKSSAWHFERLRYHSDRSGAPFPELELPDLAKLKEDLELLHHAALQVVFHVWPKQTRE
jgi:hypothetical protein